MSSLTPDQLREVRKVTLARVLCDNLDDVDSLQPNVFRPPTENGRSVATVYSQQKMEGQLRCIFD